MKTPLVRRPLPRPPQRDHRQEREDERTQHQDQLPEYKTSFRMCGYREGVRERGDGNTDNDGDEPDEGDEEAVNHGCQLCRRDEKGRGFGYASTLPVPDRAHELVR